MSDVYGVCIMPGVVIEDPELCFSTEEANSVIIPHCQSTPGGSKKGWCHAKQYKLGIQELRVKFGIENEHRNIPVHKFKQQLGEQKCSALLKAHILTGYDETTKIDTKATAMA